MRWIPIVVTALALAVPRTMQAQSTGTVTGVVTGTGGRPLTGASVAVAGTTRGDQTDAQGRFTITAVPAGSRSIRATFAGYAEASRTVTVAAGQSASVNIALTPVALALEGVVATGYATQRRQDVTGAVSSLQAENIENRPVINATQALTAQVPGVSVITSTGAPGSGAQVQVRGVSAIGAGATPLYVVDGFPITADNANGANGFTLRNPLNDIPPQDIESITVLKDASSAAIYGSRAANGVVIITTKKGRASDSPTIDIQAYTGIQRVDFDRFPKVANAAEFATFMNRRWRQLNPTRAVSEMPAEWRDPASYGEGTNWFREVLQEAPTYSATASVRGGSDRLRSYLSAGYLKQDGVLLNSAYQRLSARANVEANLGPRLTLGFNLAPTYSIRRLAEGGGNARSGGFGSTLNVWPTDSPRDENGELRHLVWGSTGGRTLQNPVVVLQERDNLSKSLSALATTYLNLELIEGVDLRSSVNLNWQDSDTEVFNPSTLWTASGPSIPSGSFSTSSSLSVVNENTITADRNLGESSRIQLLGGFTVQADKSENGSFNGSNYPNDDIRTLNAAATITGSTGESQWSMASLLGRANYTLLDRYVFTATVRADGSSRFGADNRWGTFPSAAVAWNFSREPFMQNVTFIQDAKLRLSMGYTGNNQIGNYPSIGTIGRADVVFGGAQFAGQSLNSLQNPELGWERTREVNAGIDAFFLDHRVGLVADIYRRTTEDLLLSLELPTASGFGSVTANQGSIQNQGLELGLNTTNIDTRRFRWTTNLNFSKNVTKALDLGASDTLRSGASMEGANTHITVVGGPIGLFYGYRIIGIYTPQDIANPAVAKYAGAVATDVKYKDVNGDGVIRQTEDFEVIGSPYPDFTWGMTNGLTYGPVDLRFTIDGSVGGQRLNRNLATIENIDGPFNVTKKYVEGMFVSWDSIGDGKTPSAGMSSAAGRRAFRDVSDRLVENAGFVWVRNLQLQYSVPQRFSIGANRASVYASLENPYVWTKFNGNPQTQTVQSLAAGGAPSSPSLTPGVDNFSYPLARTFTIGVNLGF